MIIDDRDLEAARAVIAAEGPPPQDDATAWLARILRVGALVAAKISKDDRAEVKRLRAKLAPIEAAARAYHAACEASRVVGGDARAASEARGRARDALGDAVYDTIADEIDAEAPR